MTAADILGGLLRTNLAAGVAILGVIALRKMVRPRFGARVAYGLWLLPVLASAAVLAPARQVFVVQSAAPAFAAASRVHQILPASPAGTAMSLDPLALLVGLWLVGVAGAALIMAHLQHRFMNQARAGAVGPAVVGVIAPRIVTPKDFAERYSPGEQTLVLAHEQAHIARQDSRLNGLCAAAQCLCWFNPLVHLAARLMRIDQELACDEVVVTRLPDARRAYAEVLVKAQLAILPLPLGCYWPSKSAHPLVERVAMLKHKDIGRARRLTGLAALAVLCAGAGLTAWAAQPAEVRLIAPKPERVAAGDRLGAPASNEGVVAPNPVEIVAGNGPSDQAPPDAAAPTITVARGEASPTPDRAVAGSDAARTAPEPLRPVESVEVSQSPLAHVANLEVSSVALIPVSNRAPDADQPLGPGHYVERSELTRSGGCSEAPPYSAPYSAGDGYRFSTRPIAPGHVITNFHYELAGDNRCRTKWPSDAASAFCEIVTDRPDKKTVQFHLFPNRNYCFSYPGAGSAQSSNEYQGGSGGSFGQTGAVTHSVMVLSFDVQ